MPRNPNVAQGQSGLVSLTIEPLPRWVDAHSLLGIASLRQIPLADGRLRLCLELPSRAAALLCARLRGLGIDGRCLEVSAEPPLSRPLIRTGRLQDARDRRDTTPGFDRPGGRATGPGRYSLTPQSLAMRLAQKIATGSVIDACCGSGGNAVAFARHGLQVTAIDTDPDRLAEAEHNARLYGVAHRITFLRADAVDVLPRLAADGLFIDPPWGNGYDKKRTELRDFPLLGRLLHLPSLARFTQVWVKLPASFDTSTLQGGSPIAWFGNAPGDRHRIKFITLSFEPLRAGTFASNA